MKPSRAVLAAAVLVLPLTGCKPGSGTIGTPNTEPAPIATSPTSSPLDSINWVVEGGSMGRGPSGETYTVNCVPADELGIDQTEQTHYREVQTDKATSYGAVEGAPCPVGPIVTEW